MTQVYVVRCPVCQALVGAPEPNKRGKNTLLDCYKCGRTLDSSKGFMFTKPRKKAKPVKFDLLKIL